MPDSFSPTLRLPAGGMDLPLTLCCGQTFSWRQEGDRFCGVAGRRPLLIRQQGDELLLQNPAGAPFSAQDTAFWRHYFALDVDYPALLAAFSQHAALCECVQFAPGLRMLHQPFFDTLLSFILSQSNHLSRIARIAGRLRSLFGEEVAPGVHAFPTAERLAALEAADLAPLRAGYRAPYLIDAARRVSTGEITEEILQKLPTPAARTALCAIRGVGQKVADCVLLYALARYDTVPADVWIRRALQHTFPDGIPAEAAGYEGIAQLYIFHHSKQNKIHKL